MVTIFPSGASGMGHGLPPTASVASSSFSESTHPKVGPLESLHLRCFSHRAGSRVEERMSLTSVLGKVAWFFLHGSWGDKGRWMDRQAGHQRRGKSGDTEVETDRNQWAKEEIRGGVYPAPRDEELPAFGQSQRTCPGTGTERDRQIPSNKGEKCLLPPLPSSPKLGVLSSQHSQWQGKDGLVSGHPLPPSPYGVQITDTFPPECSPARPSSLPAMWPPGWVPGAASGPC